MIKNRLPAHNRREEAIFFEAVCNNAVSSANFLALLCLTLTLLLTGCASNADTQPSPSVGMTTPMTSPNVTNMPSATNNMDGVLGSDAQQITTADDALTASKELRDAVEKLTEIDTATAVAIGNMALVGVTSISCTR